MPAPSSSESAGSSETLVTKNTVTLSKILIAVVTLTHKYAFNGLVQAAEAV
jgi:hypothetical protein